MLWCYGTELDWVGMVIVHPAYRRQGVGRKLLYHCLKSSSDRGVKSVGLDATDAGRPLYRSLGFQEVERLDRWRLTDPSGVRSPGQALTGERRAGEVTTRSDVWNAGFDQQRFGVDRVTLCQGLLNEAIASVSIVGKDEVILGYGLLRHGAKSSYLGPLVAETDIEGDWMVHELLAKAPQRSVLWDVPRINTSARDRAKSLGLQVQRSFVRMWKGPVMEPPRLGRIWGIADPALG